MRGYIYRKDNGLYYKCHNCGAGLSIGNLIRFLDESMYKKYVMERFSQGESGKSNYQKPVFNFKPVRFDKVEKKTYENAELLSELPQEHFAVRYVLSRKIPRNFFNELFFTTKFKSFVHEINPENDSNIADDTRIVIPFYNEYNEIEGLAGRYLDGQSSATEKTRYIKINLLGSKYVYFGKNRIDISKPIKIVEGEFDSMFLNNCLAAGGSSFMPVTKEYPDSNFVFIYDNEPRNAQIVKLIEGAINKNYAVVIWPDTIKEKDVNDMIISGYSADKIEEIISSNTFKGLEAKLKFTTWRKV